MTRIMPAQLEPLFLEPTRWIDVRAPIEFSTGAVPDAINLPLLTNDERHEIGITYKEQGQQAAIDKGHQLVCGPIREMRTQAWMEEITRHPKSVIYCFRGGLRSQISQSWVKEHGFECPIVDGGYKTLRRFFQETLASRAESLEFRVVSGPTGSGKTAYLHASGRPFLDLEAIAKHRGSAFGAMPTPQPSQADFENILAVQLLRLSNAKEPILIESESRMIGHRYIPDPVFDKITSSPKIILDVPFEERVETIFKDYILNSSLGTENDVQKFEDFRRSVRVISKKLGGLRTQEILHDLDLAQQEFTAYRNLEANRQWIQKLLLWYYDPLYKRQF